jgi:iron complex outermembrane receptor protein
MSITEQTVAFGKLAARIVGTTSVSALAMGAAMAQDAPTAAEAPTTIVVTGMRASMESALNKKREDNGMVDVIKAEDMGKFPDTNLADSLQRVPGVVIDRDAGEGRSVTVRGLGQDFTRVRINGIEGLATTGGTDSSGGANRSRGFDFNVFAAELFSSLTVRKSSSADVDEGSLGATVDLQTMRPFDLKGFNAAVSVKERYNDLSGKVNPRVAFMLSNTFFDRTLGVLVSGAYSKRQVYEEGFSTVRWDNGPSSGGWCAPMGVTPANPSNSTATTCGPAAQGVPRLPNTPEVVAAYNAASSANNFAPRLPRYGRLTHDQDRLGLTASVQWKPLPGTRLTLDMLYAKLDATRQEDFLQAISFSRSASQGGKPQTSVVRTEYDANGALLHGTYNGVDIRAESRFDELSTVFTQPTLTIEHEFNRAWRLSARLGRAESKFKNPIQTTTTLDALNVNGYAIDFRNNDRMPTVTYPFDVTNPNGALGIVGVPQVTSGTQPSNIANTTASEIRIRPQGANNRNDVAKADLIWDVIPDKLSFKAGVDLKKFTFDSYESRRVNTNDTIFAPPGGMAGLTTTISGFGKGQNLPAGTPTSWVIPDLNAIAKAYDIYCNCIKSGPAGGPGDFTLSSITNGNARGNNRSVTEEDNGVFLMGEFATDVGQFPVRGNFGARYVETNLAATGYLATGGGTLVTVDHKYSDLLPSFNLATNVSKDFIVRLAAAKVMSRPQLGNLSPGGTVATTGTLSVTSGNPLLKPFRAKTFDASFEWYFQRNAFLGLGLFRKNIDTYIQSIRANVPFNETGLPMSLLPAGFTGEEVFQVTRPINTDGGKLTGFEINYQQPFTFLPAWGKNFGTLLNYTYVKSKIEYAVSPTSNVKIVDDLLNLSPESINATLYYDNGKFSARVSASKRSGFVTRVPGQNNNDVEGKNGSLNVDLSLSYKISPKLEVTLEGVNLTNEANDQFISRLRDSVVVNNVTGREVLVGLRYKF